MQVPLYWKFKFLSHASDPTVQVKLGAILGILLDALLEHKDVEKWIKPKQPNISGWVTSIHLEITSSGIGSLISNTISVYILLYFCVYITLFWV